MAPLKSERSSVPILPFFLLRFLALVCSAVVLGILGFFVAVLRQDKLGIPWEFLILDLVVRVLHWNPPPLRAKLTQRSK
jgi:hypothetical protein